MTDAGLQHGTPGDVARTSAAPPLFLHIGRGKSGSSTIQSLAYDHVEFMKSMGIVCPSTVHGMVNHSRLAAALHAPQDDPDTIQKFRKDVRKNKRRKIFISAESLFSLTRESMQRLKRHAGDRDIRILCYVRDYPSWLQSIYAQRTKRAGNVDDFDAYYRAIRDNISALPRIQRWAESFGWEAMHVRPLLPEALVGGDLVTDVLHFLGVETLPDNVEVRNVAPHWVTLELLRALAAAARSTSIGVLDPRSVRLTREVFEKCAASVKPSRAQYFTREQWLDLAELFRADMQSLGRYLSVSFPVNLQEPPERPFLPDISVVADAVKADVLENLNTARYQSRLQAPVLELVREVLTAKPAAGSTS